MLGHACVRWLILWTGLRSLKIGLSHTVKTEARGGDKSQCCPVKKSGSKSESGCFANVGLQKKSHKVTAVVQLHPKMASGSERTLCPSISVKTDVRLSTEQIDFLVGDKRRLPFPRRKRQGLARLLQPILSCSTVIIVAVTVQSRHFI